MPQCPMDQEHEESWRMRTHNKPLTARIKLVLLVVNSVKLQLTAFNYTPKCSFRGTFHQS